MNKLLLLMVVMLFGLASVSGPTMAAGLGSGNFWTIANAEFCVEPASFSQKAPAFKPCSKKVNGHAVFCQQVAAILTLPATFRFDQRCSGFVELTIDVVANLSGGRRFRPPQVV